MRPRWLILMVAAAALTLGMTGRKASEIPVPEKSFRVTFTDREGIETAARKVSVEGEIFLTALRGETKFFVPFEKIDHIELEPAEGSLMSATVHLRSGDAVPVRVRRNLRCFGETDLGTFSVRLEALALIRFD